MSQERCVKTLLAKGADLNRADEYERCPLNIAAACCPVDIVQKLISSGAYAEAVMNEHDAAMEAAARRKTGGLPIVEAILEAQKADSFIDLYGCKVVALAEAVSFFDKAHYDTREIDGRTNLSSSITDVLSIGSGTVVKLLLARQCDIAAVDPRYGLLFQMACMAGDREFIELLLQRGINVNEIGDHHGTALQAASRFGYTKIVEHLLNSGADVNILTGFNGTALRAAVLGGHEAIVHRLIACGADVNLCHGKSYKIVLHLALEARSHAIFKALLVAGANISTVKSNQQYILIKASKQGNAALVELLLASGVNIDTPGNRPGGSGYMPDEEETSLIAACAERHPSVVRLLLDHKADIEKTNKLSATPLIAVIRRNNVSVVRLLLDAHADVNHAAYTTLYANHDVYSTPLSEAAESGNLDIVEELLSAGAIIGGPLTTKNALTGACKRRHHMVVELLLQTLSGSELEAEVCGEALSEVMEGGDPEVICLLLERVASSSFDLLRQVCSVGVLGAVEMLVNTGIDVNGNDGVDAPLLHVAASHSRPEIVQYLLNRGANVMLCSPIYGSPLIAALEGSMAPLLRSRSQPEPCRSLAQQLPLQESMHDVEIMGGTKIRHLERVVQSLFEAGAEMDMTIRTFGNALHLASYLDCQGIVRYLLQGMEDVNIFGGYFESPLIAATKGNHTDIAVLLLDRGIGFDRSSPEHGSALRCACAHGNKKLIQSLLDRGADVNAHDDRYHSVLAAAVSSRAGFEERHEIIEMLLGHEPKVHIRECDLLAAIHSVNLNLDYLSPLNLLLKYDESVVVTETVIVEAIRICWHCMDGSEDLELLLKREGGLGTTSAMLKAADSGEVIRLLLEHQPDSQITADVVLDLIGKRWNRSEMEILKVLVECGKTAEFTAEIRKALDEELQSESQQETKELFYKLEREHI